MKPSALQIRIERVAEADLPRIRTLAGQIWRSCYTQLLSVGQIEYMLEWMYSPERLLQDFRSGVVFDWPVVDGIPVGYMATELDRSARVLHLHKLYVLPQHHCQGMGSGLLNQAFQAAWDAGCQRVRLNVNKGNHPAIALYRRHGFVVEASVVNDIGGGYVMDDYVMVRPLPVSAFG